MKQPVNIKARTYSLYGISNSSDNYFKRIDLLVLKSLEIFSDYTSALNEIQAKSKNKRLLTRIVSKSLLTSKFDRLLHLLADEFKIYTLDVEGYLNGNSIFKRKNKTLAISRIQYYLYMLEAELTNRVNYNDFKRCNNKVALLPHCLKDLNDDCLASIKGFDYVCSHCRKDCYINKITTILEAQDISPYIWSGGSFKSLVKKARAQNESFGMLGIACIPELINGMHVCQSIKIPVVGLPIDGNCCRRWWGQTYQSTFNTNRLISLLK